MKPKSEDNIAGHQFRWLRAIRDGIALEQGRKKSGARRAMLTHLDALLAIDLTEFMQGRLECFRSASALARACGCSESAADAGLRRLVAAGFLEKLPPAEGDTNGKGRPASRYRVPAIFPVLERENSEGFSTSQEVENTDGEKAFSTAGQVILSTSPEGNDKRDDQKGAEAPSAPLPPYLCISDVDLDERAGSVAPERDHPPLPSEGPQEGDEPIFDPIDRDLPEIPEDVADRFRQEDEALPPLEPEAGPEDLDDDLWPTEEEGNAIDVATRDLQELHGASLDDPRDFVIGFMDGFLMGDPGAANRAARCVTRMLIESQSDAPVIWSDHTAIMRRFILATGAENQDTDAAMGAFKSAVSAAAEAIKAERRRNLPEVFAEEVADA